MPAQHHNRHCSEGLCLQENGDRASLPTFRNSRAMDSKLRRLEERLKETPHGDMPTVLSMGTAHRVEICCLWALRKNNTYELDFKMLLSNC